MGSSVSNKSVNTGTVLLCGVFDAAKGRLRIDQAVDKGGAFNKTAEVLHACIRV